MTYTPQSPLLGLGAAPAYAIQVWIQKHNAHCPVDFAALLVNQCNQAGLNADICAAQVMHETGWLTSDWFVNHRNPAGVGVTGQAGVGITFPTIEAGLHGYLAHLLTYIEGAANPWKADDPRYQAAFDAGYAGKVSTIGGLAGTWAYPGTGYADALVTLANDLVSTIGGSPIVKTFITEIDQTNWDGPNRPGYPMTPTSITVHETANTGVGADAMMHAKFVQNGGGSEGVSFHHCVDDHQAVRILPDTENAWHAGDGANGPGNRTSIAIETCVNSDGNWAATKQNLVRLLAQLCQDHGFTPNSACIVQHNHWSGKDCPHIIRAEGSWGSILNGVSLLLSTDPPAVSTPSAYVDPITGFTIGGGFLARYQQVKAALATISADEVLMVIGHATSNEYKRADGVVCQDFEHVTFEHHPGAAPDRFDVLETITHPYQAAS